MSKIRVAIAGTVGKSVSFDPNAGARAEAAVAELAAQIAAGTGGSIRHSSLLNLQVGDDHPQYTGNAFPETVTGQWNFQTIPQIQGETLAEYIEEVVGGSFFDFLQDTSSVVWTYFDTDGELEANVPPEFVQDTVGDMLTDSTSVDFTYNDSLGTFTASTINANPTGTIGLTAVNGSAATPMRSDAAPALSQAIAPTWTSTHVFSQAFGVQLRSTDPAIIFFDTDGGTDEKGMLFRQQGTNFFVQFLNDAENSTTNVIQGNRTGMTLNFLALGGTSTGPIRLAADNKELQLGTSQDLRLLHDGTNSQVRNDTGELRLQFSTTVSVAVEGTTAAFDMRQQVQFSNAISPAQLAANTDNWAPTGLSTCTAIRLSTDASRNITGITAQPGGTEIRLCNIGAQNAVLVHDATSTAANRFLCPGSANFTLTPNMSILIWYDSTSSRWRVVA